MNQRMVHLGQSSSAAEALATAVLSTSSRRTCWLVSLAQVPSVVLWLMLLQLIKLWRFVVPTTFVLHRAWLLSQSDCCSVTSPPTEGQPGRLFRPWACKLILSAGLNVAFGWSRVPRLHNELEVIPL